MTKEEKQLLLKDLCARLPYKPYVKVWLRDGDTEQGFLTIEDDYDAVLRGFVDGDIIKIKPYLRPLSSMTDGEKREWHTIIVESQNIKGQSTTTLVNDWYLEHHFDVRGLIDKCLAIEVIEENNPYK